MFKALKKQKKALFLYEQTELQKRVFRYLMRRTVDLTFAEPEDLLVIKEILQEGYAAKLSRFSARSRNIQICPFTGRTRGYYNYAKMSRLEFKRVAGAGLLPGFRKASW